MAASCVIHAGALLLPQLGTPDEAHKLTRRSGYAEAGTLHVRLTRASQLSSMAAEVREQGTGPLPTAPLPSLAATTDRPASPQRRGLGLLPTEGTAYYPTSLLSRRPEALAEPQLDDPVAKAVIASGKMVMTLWINDKGEVDKAVLDGSDLPGLFAEPTINAFSRIRFKPGELNGQAVRTVMKIEVTFDDRRGPDRQVATGDSVPNP
ncbi:MAG: energy transducer TonB [Betaproteobacteria bacterium]